MGLLSSFVLSIVLDVHSSCLSIEKGNKEILLPFKTCRSIVVGESIIASSVILYDKWILKDHKRLEKIIYFSAIIVHTSAAIYNYRQIR